MSRLLIVQAQIELMEGVPTVVLSTSVDECERIAALEIISNAATDAIRDLLEDSVRGLPCGCTQCTERCRASCRTCRTEDEGASR